MISRHSDRHTFSIYTEKKTIPEFFRQSFYITKVSEGSCLFVRKICTAYTVYIYIDILYAYYTIYNGEIKYGFF